MHTADDLSRYSNNIKHLFNGYLENCDDNV